MKRITCTLLLIVVSLVFGLGLNFILHRSTNKVIAEWKQLGSVNYRSSDPYYLSVVEGNVDWSFFLPGWERHYYIYVGRASGQPAYGYYLEFSFHTRGIDDLETHVKKSNIEWSETGVTFKEASGPVLFIPKEMFIGGR
jgi:hypothetical protein